MSVRQKVYNFLVNKQIGISKRYHAMHDGAGKIKCILSWGYLIWLNFAYYVLCMKRVGKLPEASIYEVKKLPTEISESRQFHAKSPQLSVDTYIKELMKYDVVSFDIFDTLIFRPFSEPADLFFMMGEELGIMDFKRIRMEQEYLARKDHFTEIGNYEISLADIWNRIEREVGVDASLGMKIELETEERLCYANPFMSQVYNRLIEAGKEIIIVSDMYIDAIHMRHLLNSKGYKAFKELYVSCEYGVSKCDGKLFDLVKSNYEKGTSFIHVGDNVNSDVKMAEKAGFATMYYPNVNKNALLYRPYDMSPIIGGAYRGVVNNKIYNGTSVYSIEYEYGYIYGGLFVVGYCNFIHEYCRLHNMDKILFLSRDGDILKQVYDELYPEDCTVYAYWSRKAATILMAGENRYDFVRRFLHHKVNSGITIREAIDDMRITLECPFDMDVELTSNNVDTVKDYVLDSFDDIVKQYESKQMSARQYYRNLFGNAKKVAAVDIGWAGSGAISLSHLAEKVWMLDTDVIGIIAGTNTINNAEPDASESFLQSGKLVSYLYSQSFNRDLMKKHNPNKDYNIFWELLLSSQTPQFVGFDFDENGDVKLEFGKRDFNQEGIAEIQNGIRDFADDYTARFKGYPNMFNISGRDAYAPMLLAAGNDEEYLRMIEEKFDLQVNI